MSDQEQRYWEHEMRQEADRKETEMNSILERIEALERETHDLSDEMMRAVVRSHDETGSKAIWSDVVHGWAARLAALAAQEDSDERP